MQARNKSLIILLANCCLIVMMSAVFGIIWLNYYAPYIIVPYFGKGNFVFILLFAILYTAYTQLNGGFKVGQEGKKSLFFSNFLSLFFIDIVLYIQICLVSHYIEKITPMILLFIIQIILAGLWTIISTELYYSLYSPIHLLYVYSKEEGTICNKFMKFKRNYLIDQHVDANEKIDYEKVLNEYDGVLIEKNVKDSIKMELEKICYLNKKTVFLSPSVDNMLEKCSEFTYIDDAPVFIMRNSGLTIPQEMLKRLFDLVFSVVLILLSSPFMLLTALAVKLEDHGPALYSQKRLTQGGKIFEIYKFRSMVTNAEKDGKAVLMKQNDSRVTHVGKFIRKCRLDELPQLFNILKGDMSFVGPRPERPELAEKIYETFPEFEFRLNCKAGLTGYAQVMGKYNTSVSDKLMYDLYYIENYSLFFDMKIVLMTIKTIFKSDASEGV